MAFAASIQAQTAPALSAPASATPAGSATKWPLARGEVLEVDRQEKRVTVKHGPIRNLGMDAMTMEFLVPEGEPLPPLKPHDRIRFAAGWHGGEYLMTRIELVKPRPRHR